MAKEIFIYVGPHRSGSIFLQTQVFPYIPGVCAMRARHPDCNDLVMEAMDGHPMFMDVAAIRRRIDAGIENVAEEKVIISDEEYFGDYGKYNSDGFYVSKPFYDHLQRTDLLAKLFDRAKIIITPRRQDLWVESAYMHFIHNFHTLSVEEFVNPKPTHFVFDYTSRSTKPCVDFKALDWSVYIENYYRTFGRDNVLVLPQEMCLRDLREFLDRLYAFMKVQPFYPDRVIPVNRALSRRALRLARILNRFVRTPQNPCGILSVQPFAVDIARRRKLKDSTLLWLLAGISRRISLFWFLNEVVDRFNYKKPDVLGPRIRREILDYYKEPNHKYAALIGVDLARYGYY